MPLARISLTLSRHFSLSFIASDRSSGLHPVSSYSWCMYVRAGHPAFARQYVGVHWSTSLMSSSLLLQQCPACLVRLTRIVFVMGGRIVCVLWGVAARTYSILLATFLCNCRLASSPAVYLASKSCIHIPVSIRALPGRNYVSFYRSGLIFIWSKAYRSLSMPSLAVCRFLFWLIRHCFLGKWICLPVSERFRLVWKCRLFDYCTYIHFCMHWHGGQCLQRLLTNYAVVFRLGWVYSPVSQCHRRSRCR